MKQTLPAPRESAGAFHGLEAFRRQVDRLFDDFAVPSLRFGSSGLVPEVDYAETDKDVIVTVELPGVDAKDVDISLTDGALTIRGEKKSERDEKKAHYRLTERSYGAFERTMRIPDGVDADKVRADFENGVLRVTLPKTEASRAKSRKIEVKAMPQ
jgi:HSP20 family protein